MTEHGEVVLALFPGLTFAYAKKKQMDVQEIGSDIYCRGSCVHALAQNVTEKCMMVVNRLLCSLVLVLYIRT